MGNVGKIAEYPIRLTLPDAGNKFFIILDFFMCTVTCLLQKNGYQIFFNRDELKTRRIALPPSLKERNGVKYIAPTDADAGGSWLCVNQFGLSLGLLNYYHGKTDNSNPAKEYISRGLLLNSLVDSAAQSEAIQRLNHLDLSDYRPFILTIWEPGKTVAACTWDHSRESAQVIKNVIFPLSSSSFNSGQVIGDRRALFQKLASDHHRVDTDFLISFHHSHLPEPGPYSVCMHREDAQTVSLSGVSVTPEKIEFYYTPGPPCQTSFLPPVTLPRIRKRTEYGYPANT